MTIGLAVLIFLDLIANNLEPVALAAGSDVFIQDDEGVQEMRENPVIIKTCGLLLNNGLSQQAAHDTGKLYHSRVNFAMRIFSAGKEI